MAKELPYFKFEPNEWSSGMIQLCSLQSKGLFIELCSLYWSRLGDLPYALALQKLCTGNASLLQELENNQIYEIEDEKIIIRFLDNQLDEFQDTSEKRRKAANKRWSNANAMQVQSKSNAIREEKRREEKSKEDRKAQFKELLTPFRDQYDSILLNDFFLYWTESGQKDRKMRFEKEKSFSVERRLMTWKKNELKFNAKNQKAFGSNSKPPLQSFTKNRP